MLILIPMNSKDIHEAVILPINEAKIWAQLRIHDGRLVEVVHSENVDDFEACSDVLVIKSDTEDVVDFMSMGMTVLVAHTQRDIENIVEAYLFRELYELNY